jgi:hypothetical protein
MKTRLLTLLAAALLCHAPLAAQVSFAPGAAKSAPQDLQADVADIADDAKWWAAYQSLQGRAERGQHREVIQALADAYRDDQGEPRRRMRLIVRQLHLVEGEKTRRAEASRQAALIAAALADLDAAAGAEQRTRARAAATRAIAALQQVLEAPEKPLVLPVNPPPGKQPAPPPAFGGEGARIIRTKDGRDAIITPPEGWGDDELEAEFTEAGLIVKRKRKATTQPAPKPEQKREPKPQPNPDRGGGSKGKDEDPGQDPIAAAISRARPTAAEDAWRLIPWHDSLGAALEQATRTAKPVFFFGVDGVLETGHC